MTIKSLNDIFKMSVCLGVLGCSMSSWASTDSEWDYAVELYGLAATTKTTLNDESSSVVDFGDVWDVLDFAAMGTIAAKKDKLSLFANMNYVNVGDKESISADDDLRVNFEAFFMTLGAGWVLQQSDRSEFSLLGGARYLDLRADLDLIGAAPMSVSDRDDAWDAVIGLRGIYQLGGDWYFHYYGDVGGGSSKSTWHVKAAIDYDFDPLTVELGYSYITWEFDDKELVKDVSIYGPYLGIKYRF